MFTLNTVIIVFVELALNLAMSKWPHRPTFMLGAACLAVGFGSLGLAHSAAALFGAVAVWTFGEMILLPALSDAVASLAPAERRGGYMGLLSFTYSVGLAAGPALGLQAYAYLGPRAMWGGCFGLGMLSVLLVARNRAPAMSTSTAAPGEAAATVEPATE
jgi:MFS family permease